MAADGHLGHYHVLRLMNKAARIVCAQVPGQSSTPRSAIQPGEPDVQLW